MSEYVLRAGDTLSGTLESEDKNLEVAFMDGMITFQEKAGIFEHDGDLELSSQLTGQFGLSELTHHASRHASGGEDVLAAPGNNQQVIFNDSGALGADSGFAYNKTSNTATLTGGLTTSLIESPAATDLRILPPSDYALLIGESGGSAGSFRRIAYGDNPAAQTYAAIYCNLEMTPSGGDTTNALLHSEMIFNSSNSTHTGKAIAGYGIVEGSDTPGRIIGCNGQVYLDNTAAPNEAQGVVGVIRTASGYSGTAPSMTGVLAEGLIQSGTVTLARMFAFDNPVNSGTISTLIGYDVPSVTAGNVNYGFRLGENTHLWDGNQIFKQSEEDAFSWSWQDYEGNNLVQITSGGNVYISGDNGKLHLNRSDGENKVKIGAGESSQFAYLDLIGDSTYTTFGARFIRENTGANADTIIYHRGTGNLILWAYDNGGIQMGAYSSQKIGFLGTAPISKPTVSGSKSGNAALANLCTALANLGLITNSTT